MRPATESHSVSPGQLRALFDEAMDLPEDGRERFLQRCDRSDAALGMALRRLLDASAGKKGFLESRTIGFGGLSPEDVPTLPPGHLVGNYEIVSELGRGGNGVVYLARQTGSIEREVALKILSVPVGEAGLSTQSETEPRVLARMEHDHIAKLYETGVDAIGRRWFAMELVRGEAMTAYCDKHGLGDAQRLRLFSRVARAVHHAHLKGIIHRDLKPSNLLVTGPPEDAVPKIIDFGIASFSYDGGAKTLMGKRAGLVGTPAYVSPEQFARVAGSKAKVDERADIYSLGVVLQELLPGLASRSSGQAVDFRRVVAKCLHRDVAGRFDSAESLSGEIDNLLAHRPLGFVPRHPSYLTGKFIRRHRIGLGLVVAGAIAVIAGLHLDSRQRQAEFRAKEAERRAEREARKGYLIAQSMSALFLEAAPEHGLPRERTVRSVVEEWTAELPAPAREDAGVEALCRLSLGVAWKNFGDEAKAREQFNTVASLLENPAPAFYPARALAEFNLAGLDVEGDTDGAGEHLARARTYFSLSGHHHSVDLLRTDLLLAAALTDSNKTREAREVIGRVLREAESKHPGELVLQAKAWWCLARVEDAEGNTAEWANHLRRRLELIRRIENPAETVILEAKFDAARADFLTGQDPVAGLEELDRILRDYSGCYGPGHPFVLAFRQDVIDLLNKKGLADEASARAKALARDRQAARNQSGT